MVAGSRAVVVVILAAVLGACSALLARVPGPSRLAVRPRAAADWPAAAASRERARAGAAQMCGLVAVFDDSLSAVEIKELTVELTKRIEHRGPDEVGFHGGDGWGLGHARLSIMDPAAGIQPLISRASGAAVVHNGEIYNHAALRVAISDEREAAGKSPFDFTTGSDSEVVLPLFEDCDTAEAVASRLDGMFGIVVVSADGERLMAARDPCGIKPLYRGWSRGGRRMIIASELKCLVGAVEHAELVPPGHVWTRENGYVRYFQPEWLRAATAAREEGHMPLSALPTGGMDNVRRVLRDAVKKRLMSDVGYGLLLSGGLDSAIVATLMAELTDMRQIKSFTVGQPNSPDVMAARAMAKHVGTEHHEYLFTPDEAFAAVDQVVWHLETYEPELIRSAIPNFFLAKLAGSHVKVVLTGEGADELFGGYLYFRDCPDAAALHGETVRIWEHLSSVNLQRADRMCMAHGLEARVPFLDVSMLEEAYSVVNPAEKMHVDGKMEKWALRNLFEGEIPHDVLWRTKAMQCEGVGMDWVSQLQSKCADAVSDTQFAAAAQRFPLNTPQSKEEYYYRALFEKHFGEGWDRFVHVWEGGCRAGGAPWQNSAYTRAGLLDTSQLKHGLMADSGAEGEATPTRRLRDLLVSGGDTRLKLTSEGLNSYHCPPLPHPSQIVRGSCTGSPPTDTGVASALDALARLESAAASDNDDASGGGASAAMAKGVDAEMSDVRARLASALQLPEGSGIVLAASGTCAEYIPLAIAQQLYPDADGLRSVLAADGETGSGGPDACAARYFNQHVPLPSELPPTAGGAPPAPDVDPSAVEVGTPLDGFPDVHLLRIAARTHDGKVNDAQAALDAAQWPDASAPVWVVRQVLGSKTGVSTPALTVPAATGGDARLLEVVDACQLRTSLAEVREALDREAMVLLTGSKFFQGSFSAAAVVLPPAIMARLQRSAKGAQPLPAGLRHFISAYEVPSSLAHWRSQLGDTPNAGLALRWHTALPLVEGVFALAPSRRASLMDQWTEQVRAMLAPHAGRIDEVHAERGIVSVVLRKPDGSACSKAELKAMHRILASDASHLAVGDAAGDGAQHASRRCFVGQPVDVASDRTVLRLAMGAELLLQMDAGTYEAADDEAVVSKMAWLLSQPDALLLAANGDAPPASQSAAGSTAAHSSAARVPPVVASVATALAYAPPPATATSGGGVVPGTTKRAAAAAKVVTAAKAAKAGVAERRARRAIKEAAIVRARTALRECDAVCFDVDATVIADEGIDSLATYLGCREQVEAITVATQCGLTPFHDALAQRLDTMRPSRAQLDALLAKRTPADVLTPRALELIEALRARGTHVYLVSGGFRQMIEPVAHAIGVPPTQLYCNRLLFDERGDFAGIDHSEPTSRAGGKAKVVAELKASHGYTSAVMVGDGATDMEARDVPGGADVFIGFGGVRVREKVREGADWFVTDFGEMIDALADGD